MGVTVLPSTSEVRRECSDITTSSDLGVKQHEHQRRRVGAKDSMKLGDQIFLPITVEEVPSERTECFCNEEEINFLSSLELYKDAAIIVVNKPPGMPVQVQRLDRDSSGILVMGRTQTSTRALHSIFREKTSGASNNDLHNIRRILQRRYWALVIGSPRRSEGILSVPLKKVIVDDGKSERITVVDNPQVMSSQLAITQYRVIVSSCQGYTWLELSPLTGRKHQVTIAGYTWLELSPLTGRKHQVTITASRCFVLLSSVCIL
ncbi:RNA pseudouridine synthase [Actinidia chinensis var. chinensis]|uniref:RNA pseudouridine synthase n=1 Tax=Actinidia chinensis var. chinensis TaxID=1590841 RepID=A0A2R6R1W6_ACTCC|nr:RNA pseudouridine synthase [Actinidia chinensis var. chinensis]